MKNELITLLSSALKYFLPEAVSREEIESSFEIPREEKFGDLSSNIVMKLARRLKRPPRPLAEELIGRLNALISASALAGRVSKISLEGPGFINFYYSDQEITGVLDDIVRKGENFGKPVLARKKKILLEFVSSNPTGPLTVAHGRQAALGDSLAKILIFAGHEVHKEYYNNDEGVQIQTLGRSIQARYLEEIGEKFYFPEEGYKGEYIRELSKDLVKERGRAVAKESETFFSRYGKETILACIQKDLKDFGVEFDAYFSQETLMKSGRVEETLKFLESKGFVYEKEGATWFASTRLGDDKDRVLIKSDKSYTYLTPDIAYHRDKLERKFDLLINILGPDHHGYIGRIKAAVEALGYSRDHLEVLIAQLVTLFEGEKTLRMSTRAGEFVTLREIMDEVGVDAGRFFFLMRKFDAHLDFDLALAKSQTVDNPVFYIQYAHARIESIKKLQGAQPNASLGQTKLFLLRHPSEIRVMRLLSQYENIILSVERTLEPYRVVAYLMELAAAFHKFYTENRVITEDKDLTEARMQLISGVQTVLRSGLGLLGVSAPLKM